MRIGHSRPNDITWTVSGSGASIDTSADELTDGRPDSLTAFTWRDGTQSTSTEWKLRAEWTSGAIVPGLVGILNIDLPVGTKVQVAFRRSGDSAGTYPYAAVGYVTSQRIVEGPAGERTAWFAFQPSSTPVVGCQISIFNDVNGSPTIVASQDFTIGEIFIGSSTDMNIALSPTEDNVDQTTAAYSWNNQPYTVPGVPYRTLQFALQTTRESVWINTYRPLLAKINQGKTCAYVLSMTDVTGAFSVDILHASAFIGIATKLASRHHLGLRMFDSGTLNVVESPIPTS